MGRKLDIDVGALGAEQAYRLLTAVVVPRPIAWITTLDVAGKVNVAPFSFFTCLASNPPMVGVTVMRRRGQEKDTVRNARELGEYVINIVTRENAEAMNLTSIDAPFGTSELELAGLHAERAHRVRVPGIAESPVWLECRLSDVLTFGKPDGASNPTSFLVGEVVHVRLDEEFYREGRVDLGQLRVVGRLGGNWYTEAVPLWEMVRPRWDASKLGELAPTPHVRPPGERGSLSSGLHGRNSASVS